MILTFTSTYETLFPNDPPRMEWRQRSDTIPCRGSRWTWMAGWTDGRLDGVPSNFAEV